MGNSIREGQSVSKTVVRIEAQNDEFTFETIYTTEFLNIHFATSGEVEGFLIIHPKDAMKLMYALRDSLQDIHTETDQ